MVKDNITFTRSQLILLSGIKDTMVRRLHDKGAIASVSSTRIVYSIETVVICLLIKSMRQFYPLPSCLVMTTQLGRMLAHQPLDINDLYHFQAWNKFAIGYTKLTDSSQWEENRWLIRLLSSHDCQLEPGLKICQRLGEVKITPQGESVAFNPFDEALVCVYLRGAIEKLLLASFPHPKLYDAIASALFEKA